MKIYITILLMSISLSAMAQKQPYVPYRTNGNVMVKDSALSVGQFLIPTYTSPSLGAYADRWGQSFGINRSSKSINVRGNGSWLVYPDSLGIKAMITSGATSTNLALGTPTTTTQPITNSNGTGFTLLGAVPGVSAGLQSASDKTKLDAITGTNTGNQTLSLGTTSGNIVLSGSGGNVSLPSLTNSATTVFADANTTPASAGFYIKSHTTGSSNYNDVFGGGFGYYRSNSTAVGAFEFDKSVDATTDLRFRVGTGVSTFSAWDIVAGRTYIAGIYAPLASPALTGIPTTTTATAGTNTTQIATTAHVKALTNSLTGWANYSDNVYTVGSPLVVNAGSTTTLTNNAATVINTQLPTGVTSFYNSGTSKITPINDGDGYIINVRFYCSSNSAAGLMDVSLDIGGAMNIIAEQTVSLDKGIGATQRVNINFVVFSAATFIANGGLIKINSVTGNTSIYNIVYMITRTHRAKF